MELNDETLVALLQKRVQAPDCYSQGFILEDFPRTKSQAVLMSQKGLVPTNVIHLRGTFQEAYKRTEATKLTDFGSNRIILGSRLRHYQENLNHVTNFYNSTYSSLQEIDAFKSKWFIQD
jgi:adenylate kinase family enzyme